MKKLILRKVLVTGAVYGFMAAVAVGKFAKSVFYRILIPKRVISESCRVSDAFARGQMPRLSGTAGKRKAVFPQLKTRIPATLYHKSDPASDISIYAIRG